jgi:hypothetical protein
MGLGLSLAYLDMPTFPQATNLNSTNLKVGTAKAPPSHFIFRVPPLVSLQLLGKANHVHRLVQFSTSQACVIELDQVFRNPNFLPQSRW